METLQRTFLIPWKTNIIVGHGCVRFSLWYLFVRALRQERGLAEVAALLAGFECHGSDITRSRGRDLWGGGAVVTDGSVTRYVYRLEGLNSGHEVAEFPRFLGCSSHSLPTLIVLLFSSSFWLYLALLSSSI